jgi:RecB family exonuclease
VVERPRPPFRVQGHELVAGCELDGVALRVRIDRVDEVAPGTFAVIDYKSGRAVRPLRWFAQRPEGVQLALYAHALRTADALPVRVLAFGQLKAGDIAVAGLTDRSALWPALDVVGETARVPATDWNDAQSRLLDGLVMLAREIRDGVADVTPRNATTCRRCRLHSLCRIQLLDDHAERPDGSFADD